VLLSVSSTCCAGASAALRRSVLAAAIGLALLGPAAAQDRSIRFPGSGEVVSVQMTPSKAMTVQTNVEFADVVVANPEMVDVEPLTSRSLYMLARKNGRTNVLFYDTAKRLVGMIDVEVTLDLGELKKALRASVPSGQLSVSLVNNRIRLSGTVPDGISLRTALDIAAQFSTDPVINTVRVTDAQQVMLQVRFLEAKRDAGRELGVGWKTGNTGANDPGLTIGVAGRSLPSGAAPFGTLISRILDSGISVDVVVKALETKNLARRLAEPNLVAQSGETASFLAGGEFPIPVPGGLNQPPTIQYKEYGIRLTFTPIVLDDGLINLQLEPEVSEIDSSVAISTTGAPAFVTRRTKTTVELHDGQSFAIAGLLQSTNMRVQDQIPWLGQVPVLGALFRSSSYQKRETNLVVIITPHIVRPARPGEPLRPPLDKDMAGNDAEFFLIGTMEVTDDTLRRFATGAGVSGPYGHIIDLGNSDVR
jgi:pilus assembly protein CpaC